MPNPWLYLRTAKAPYVLDEDRDLIERFNNSASDDRRIITDSLPQPYIGNPETARVVFLALNPGHADKDYIDHKDEAFKDAASRNLSHTLRDYPFYPLNPAFRNTGAGEWWHARTRELRTESGVSIEAFSERIMVIEWFPYHSRSFAAPKQLLPSQRYSFELATRMLHGKLTVRMRAKARWNKVHESFATVKQLSNPQCSYLTKRNLGENTFELILQALR